MNQKIMENLADYSNYVFATYAFVGGVLSALMIFVIAKYFAAKSKLKK